MTYTDTGAQSEGTPRNGSAFSSTGLCYIWCRHIVDWYTHHAAPANRQSSLTRDRTSVPVAEYLMSQPIIPCTITEHYPVTTRSEITLYCKISTVANERIWSELSSQNAPHYSPVCALHYWNNLPCYKGRPWMERYLPQLPAIWDTVMLLGRHSNIRCDQKISKSPIINTVYLLLDLQCIYAIERRRVFPHIHQDYFKEPWVIWMFLLSFTICHTKIASFKINIFITMLCIANHLSSLMENGHYSNGLEYDYWNI